MADTEQSITIKVAGKEYPLKVKSPEAEHYMRFAAEEINNFLAKYDQVFPETQLIDKMVFVALNETMVKLQFKKKIKGMEENVSALEKELSNYLSDK